MRYNIRRGRATTSNRGRHQQQQQQQPQWMGFFSQLVSVLNTFVGGAPTRSRGRGRGGEVRGTHLSGRPYSNPGQAYGDAEAENQNSEPPRGRPNYRSTSRETRRGRGRSSRSRGQSAGRGRGRGQQTYHQQRQNPQQQNHGPPQQSDRHFTSNNPDFTNLVKGINQGTRLQHAQQNWDKLPNTLDRATDRVSESIRPPLSDDKLSTKIKRAADHFKFAVVHAVQEHITDKYNSVCRHLASVDDSDFDHAKNIAQKQISRSSGKITEQS